jgi:riboflavin synthase alpha subunit
MFTGLVEETGRLKINKKPVMVFSLQSALKKFLTTFRLEAVLVLTAAA